jgi:hypothetical protein
MTDDEEKRLQRQGGSKVETRVETGSSEGRRKR